MPHQLELDHPNIVLRGSFNPSIIQPQWLARHQLIPAEEADTARIDVISAPVASFSTDWFQLQVTQDRFSATATGATPRALPDLVLGIFRLLLHTPLESLGINRSMHFSMSTQGDWHEVGHRLAPKELWASDLQDPGMRSLTMEGRSAREPEAVLRITVEPSTKVQQGVYVAYNRHHAPAGDLSARRLMSILHSTWDSAQEEAVRMAEHILNTAVGVGR